MTSILAVLFTVFNLQGVPIANMQHRITWFGPVADCEKNKASMSQSVAGAFAPSFEAYWTKVYGATVVMTRKQWCEPAAE